MQSHEQRQFRRRLLCCCLLFVVAMVVIGLRVGHLQLIQAPILQRLAEEQYLNTVRLPARRGQIFDRFGQPLAVSKDVPSVFANPQAVAHDQKNRRTLAKILALDVAQLEKKLNTPRYFVWLKRHVSPQEAQAISQLQLHGVGIRMEPRRFYPNGETGAAVIGFAGRDGQGLEGIERYFDGVLAGEPQLVPAVRDARGRTVLGGYLDPEQRARGEDVVLTLDVQLQHTIEALLSQAVEQTKAKGAMALVMDVASTEVLSLAVVPLWDANQASTVSPAMRRNRAVTDMFEPGSVLKPFVVAGALAAGVVQPLDILPCHQGKLLRGGHLIHDVVPREALTVHDIVAKSSNIGMVQIGEALGAAGLEQVLHRLGFVSKTGIELPGEAMGLLRPRQRWSAVEQATLSFGQGMAVNLIQLAAAYRIFAAQGQYKPPTLLRGLQRPDGEYTPAPYRQERTIFSQQVAAQLVAMLEAAATAQQGTGRRAQVPGFRVAGKTGTAQQADPDGSGYGAERFMSLFAGFLPVHTPSVVIVVALEEPQGEHGAGVVAAPLFAQIGLATMQRLGLTVAPDTLVADQVHQVPVHQQLPGDWEPVDAPMALDIPPRYDGTWPTLIGLSARQIIENVADLRRNAGFTGQLVIEGTGRCVGQQPVAGSRIFQQATLHIQLAPEFETMSLPNQPSG